MPASRKLQTETQVSAGGAVLRNGSTGLEIALISVGAPPRWQLPKGLIDKGETPEIAAVREVKEEAGIDARCADLLEQVEYWYQSKRGNERIRYHKFVNFFLMWYESGDVSHHDNEVNEARWFPVADAIPALAFRSERAIVQRAAEIAGT
jgi:8-oxo-dGTP pyrophosphatase MutT (NUDIX family)